MKKIIVKRLNENGSVLQITLIAFLIFTFSLTVCLTTIKQNVTLYHYIDILMEQKNLEIMLTRYYIEEMENSILLSDSYDIDDYAITYLVDHMGEYYDISTTISTTEYSYGFNMNITLDTYEVTSFAYTEE